ncbi:hypothetical protein BU25DRAFT_407550 [Macroventuria anomochaeta]|uniref:Uncharacterized protein n=1 Tax=Macroventuria anomochaeta TaxID=301207 RepID=A0ACB6SD15_9PLEO|nr:uncharacterized protein BU25DRAFT_407550 [Macroventuria anomochaeta]KAF2630982.1 hypothetical protein BU25DRAFT_407550 [Macroventuria anomochaeta]
MPSRSFILSFLYATSLVAAASQKCYSLTGAELDDTFAPCNSTAKHSGCCATNRPAGSADICLDSGLCMATKSEYMGTIWQPGCTDSTGKATECPQLCPGANNDFDGLNPVSAWNIQTCDFGTYCCRAINDRRNCCNNSTAPRITTSSIGAFQLQTATAVSSSTSTAASSSAIATESSSNLEATLTFKGDVCKSERHKTAVVGGAVGGMLGAAVVGLMGVVCWMSKREQRQRKLKEHYEEQFSQTWAYRKAMAASSTSMKTDVHEEFNGKPSGS